MEPPVALVAEQHLRLPIGAPAFFAKDLHLSAGGVVVVVVVMRQLAALGREHDLGEAAVLPGLGERRGDGVRLRRRPSLRRRVGRRHRRWQDGEKGGRPGAEWELGRSGGGRGAYAKRVTQSNEGKGHHLGARHEI